jgi:predicted metalloendopeptidase
MVRNIGVPDFVLDDNKLNAYYSSFTYSKADDFVSVVLDLKAFARKKQLEKLVKSDGIDRTEFYFNLYPDPIWSAYDLNSITFTLDVLQPPLYSPDYPSALNFGLLGSLIGHEIGHAFDMNGLMFDQFGQLKNWFDMNIPEFMKMTQCLAGQYKSFCPDTATCKIDPDNTLNDNLADNTGLQAALRGFRNWVNLKGQDPRLPDSTLDQFNNEQLFFLGYAQQYCPKTDFSWYNFGAKQSPNEYRLLGTLSNSQNFRSTFNCAAGKKYAPKDYCEIWTSKDDKPVLGLPETETERPSLNIQENYINHTDEYKSCAKTIEDTIDTRIDPCDDFYGYVCKRYQGPGTFTDVFRSNQVKMVLKLRETDKPTDLKAVKLEKDWYNKCFAALDNWDKLNEKAPLITKIMNALETEIGVKFPLANGNPDPTKKTVTPEKLGQAIGFLNRNYENLSPLIGYFIFNDIVAPENGYRIYFDGPLLLGLAYWYQDPNYETKYKPIMVNSFAQALAAYFSAAGIAVTDGAIVAEATQLAQFEWALAQGLGPGAQTLGDIYNLITVSNVTTFFPNSISMPSLLAALSKDVEGLPALTSDPEYVIALQSPDNYGTFLKNLETIGTYAINDNTVWNYFFVNIIVYREKYLPGNQGNIAPRDLHVKKTPPKGVPEDSDGIHRREPELPKSHPSFADNAITINQLYCSIAVGSKFTEINNRLFVEALFPDPDKRDEVRLTIATIAESIGISFRSMIDQLTWLRRESKKGAYNKLDLFVHNILHPNQTFDDDWMDTYYTDLNWDTATANFLDLQLIIGTFLQNKDLKRLTVTTGADRTEFGDTSQVNAYYRPSSNSLTILAGITQPPFYQQGWPSAVNYGAIGMVVGHECTHGFDNGGVMWDGRGAYREGSWMDPASKKDFDKMAKCIINEYNGFCMDESHCVKGSLTQGENIADNGGIRVAFRAYKNYVGLNGEDPRLPGELASQFTNDQLFFIGFTRNWCEDYYLPPSAYNWHEAHSPGPYRIFGTLQNFDHFRAAFNCPIGTKYAPKDKCQVWIEDVKPVLGVPTPPTELPKINMPVPQIAAGDNAAYKEVADYFTKTIDTSQSPCDNFHSFVCSKLGTQPPNKQLINKDVAERMADAIGKLDDVAKPYNIPIKDYYGQCVATLTNAPDPVIIASFVGQLNIATGIPFPLFDSVASPSFDNARQLATAIGYLSGTQAINTLIDADVVKNLDATSTQKYILHIGEPLLTVPPEFYKEPARASVTNGIRGAFFDVLNVTRTLLNKPAVTDSQLNDAAESFYNIESALAANTRSAQDRKDAKKAQTYYTITQLKAAFTSLDWDEYFSQLTDNGPAAIGAKFQDGAYKVSVAAKDNLANVLKVVSSGNSYGVTADMFANYLNFRALWDLRTSLFQIPDNGAGDLPVIGEQGKLRQYICALETRELTYLHSRVYVDSTIGLANVDKLREEAAKLANRIIGSLKSQVQQTSWISAKVKQNAGAKFDNLTLNTLIDNNALNEDFLNRFYGNYKRPATVNPANVLAAARAFSIFNSLNLLSDGTTINRDDFVGSSSDTWPRYDALTNSLSIPAAISRKPLFDPAYPLASNYGGLGYLVAHSLAHSLDQFGIEFDDTGNLKDLVDDPSSLANFTAMSTCLITQYSKFCPLPDGDYSPNCLDGKKSLAESIADNAGIHAAYTAYQAASNFKGADPRLNNPILSQFTEDQLFFLTYARDFCALPQDKDTIFANIVAGADSPPEIRVLASLRNYPAFGSAFNCPANSRYVQSADQICTVWTSESSAIPHQ